MNKLRLTILAIAISIFASNASAFDPEDLQKLMDTNSCYVECDLTEADLQGAELENADLEGALMFRANLKGADLSYAIMNSVILCNTIIPDGSVIYSGC